MRIGKIPIEEIAVNLAARTYQKNPQIVSPRTREVIGISQAIQKNFKEHAEPPKTTSFHYRAGKMLGRGAFGKVTLGMHKLVRKLVALKSINKEFMSDDR